MDDIETFLNGHPGDVIAIVAQITALLIIWAYRSDEESGPYKVMMAMGVIMGILMMVVFVGRTTGWNYIDKAIVYLLAFSLIIRPFKDLHLAIAIAAAVQVLVYFLLGETDVEIINSGWGRIIISAVVLIFVYGLLHLVFQVVQIIGKIFNWYPFLGTLAILCLANAVLMMMDQKSIGLMILG